MDERDLLKVDKEIGKMLSSNDFTDGYKTKIDTSIQGIKSSDVLINPQNGVINLTPAVLKCMASNVVERSVDASTYFLRIHTERISSGEAGSFYVVMSDRNGSGLFSNAGSILIYHMAIDIGDPTRYLFSIGYKKDSSTTHHLNVISNNALTIGDRNNLGTQVINNTDGRNAFVRQAALCVRL